MKVNHIALLYALVLASCTYPRPIYIMTANPEIKEILREYSTTEHGITHIDLTRFERSAIKYEELEKKMPDECYFFNLPNNPNIEDEFLYRIIKERDSDRFWVIRFGGVAGVFEIYELKTEPGGALNQITRPYNSKNH